MIPTKAGWTACRVGLALVAVLVVQATALQAGPGRLFVLPFDLEPVTPRNYWLGEGVALLVDHHVEALGGEVVGRQRRIAALEELRVPEAASLTRATMIRVAEAAAATDVVVGRAAFDDARITLQARLLRLDTGAYSPEIVETGPATDLVTTSRRLAARLMRGESGAAEPLGAESSTDKDDVSLEAFEAYVKGLLDERPEARLRLLKAAIARDPGFDRPWLALWAVHTEGGAHAAALAAARSVTSSSPRGREAQFLAALSLIDLQRYDEAYVALMALERLQPTPAVLNNLGVVQLRRVETAQTGRPAYYFTKAADAQPDDPDICFNLGYAYWMDQDHRAAVYWLREAVRRRPQDADAHAVLAAALASLGASLEAGRERELAGRLSSRYDEWVRRGNAPDSAPRGLERLVRHFDLARRSGLAAVLGESAQRDSRALAAFYLDRARQSYADQRDAEATVELRKCLYLSPYDADAHVLLGRIQMRGGRPAEAIPSARLALWSRESAEARLVLAEALLETGEAAAARVEAQRALQLAPDLEAARALMTKIDAAAAAK